MASFAWTFTCLNLCRFFISHQTSNLAYSHHKVWHYYKITWTDHDLHIKIYTVHYLQNIDTELGVGTSGESIDYYIDLSILDPRMIIDNNFHRIDIVMHYNIPETIAKVVFFCTLIFMGTAMFELGWYPSTQWCLAFI